MNIPGKALVSDQNSKRLTLAVAAVLLFSIAAFLIVDFDRLSLWIINQQRLFQTQMSSALWSLRTGEITAYLALFAAAGGYGFVHALGPGHGKYLVGGVGLGSSVTTAKLVSLAVISSLFQALWAIVLVYGGFSLLELSADRLRFLSEDVLAPVSYGAIGIVGVILAWRGLRSLSSRSTGDVHDTHDESCGCGHSHGPTTEDAERVGSLKEAAALVLSIAIRPCTGAMFLLIVAWQMDIKLAGAIAALVMGLGTALLTGIVAVSSVAARQLAFFSASGSSIAGIAFPTAQIIGGMMICWISIALLLVAI